MHIPDIDAFMTPLMQLQLLPQGARASDLLPHLRDEMHSGFATAPSATPIRLQPIPAAIIRLDPRMQPG